jgi:ABC-2 type transport system permease protein
VSAGSVRLAGAAAAGIVRRDARLYLSYRLRGFLQLATIFLSLALFFYLSRLVGVQRFPTPGAYFAYAVVGLAIVEVLTAAMSAVPAGVRQELLTGTFERLVVSPFGPVAGIASMAVFPLGLALVTATATILFAGVVFGMDLAWDTVPLALPVAVLGAFAFLPFALLVTAIVLVIKAAGALTTYIVTGLSLTSGVLFPVALLPWYLEWISHVQPLTPALDLLRHLLLGTPLNDPAAAEVLRLVLFALVLLPVSLLVLRATVERCRRAGTLIEY